MEFAIFAMVLAAAALHALWNALVKGGADKGVSMSAVVIGQGLCGAVALAFVEAPNLECWPYLALSIALHLGYQVFLLAAYRVGDLTQVYPIARGSAPLIVAFASVLFLGVTLAKTELIAVAFIACGVMSLALGGRGDSGITRKAGGLALTTGVFIAAYSLTDGLGARLAGSSVGYYGWVAIGNASCFSLYVAFKRPGLLSATVNAWRIVAIGGGASFIAYALVVYAFTQAPIALVTALRETSIVFALGIGVFVLKEPVNVRKVASIAVVMFGAALLRLGKG